MAFRFIALILLFTGLYGALVFHLYGLQIERGAEYIAKVQAQVEFAADLALRRGQIFFTDRNEREYPVAQNRDFPVIYAVPASISSSLAVANLLSPILGKSVEELQAAVDGNRTKKFRVLVDRASQGQVDAVAALSLPSVGVTTQQYRSYPSGSLGSHVLGFYGFTSKNPEPTGLYGVEKYSNDALARGDDIRLTIDRNIQAQIEDTLKKLLEEFQAVQGTIIVAEPATGKILALASKPDFDPNLYSASPVGAFVNPAVSHLYEPGSVIKPFTMAAGIDAGAFTPDTTYTDTGSVTLNGKTITNYDQKAYGTITMATVLEHSVNTGAVFAEQTVGPDRFYNYMKNFGFSEKTNIGLPDEVSGSLRNLKAKTARAIDFATASYGQGIALTPIELVMAYGALANSGVLMRPSLSPSEEPFLVRRVISPETAHAVTRMLELTVATGKVAVISGYRVAGKTGTAFIPDFERGGYTTDMIHTFVGYAPASNPRYVILVKLDKPSVGELAGLTVVPSFRELMSFVLNYGNVPPDNISASLE